MAIKETILVFYRDDHARAKAIAAQMRASRRCAVLLRDVGAYPVTAPDKAPDLVAVLGDVPEALAMYPDAENVETMLGLPPPDTSPPEAEPAPPSDFEASPPGPEPAPGPRRPGRPRKEA